MAHHSTPPCDPKLRRGRLAWAVMLFALLLATPAVAGGNCPAGATPEVRVISEMPPPDYRHRLTRSQIGALGGHGHMTSDRSHAGLTRTQTSFSVNPMVQVRQIGNGQLCVSLQRVEINWRMVEFIVDVAAEYRRGSCPYEQILSHENQHVDIAQRAFTAADRGLRQQLGELARRQQGIVVRGTPQQAANQVAQQFMAVAKPILEQYDRDTRRQNAAIDTQENYRAISSRCRDW
ncbi:MAG: hypothetical protein ACM3Q1_16825 [Bacteroidales bacterium]